MAAKPSPVEKWIKQTLKQDPPRSKSLIVTIFGDSILPCARGIWLSELIALLAPFHVNERLVRTSAFRLAEEGWLQSQREGRKSRYALTSSGLQRVEHAYHRIYDPAAERWDGKWTLVFLNKTGNLAAARAQLRRELDWAGFGLLAPGAFLHPSPDLPALREIFDRLKLAKNVLVFEARDLSSISSRPATKLAAACWNLESVATRYRQFLKRFHPALEALRKQRKTRTEPEIDPQTAFTIQTLLIHSFRRIVLHDPRLPAALLPEDWPGHLAYHLCRDIYGLTCRDSQTYLAGLIEPTAGVARKPNEIFARRFGYLTS